MTATNEQIRAEARRRTNDAWGAALEDAIIEVMRENWTPPEPVDDVLAFREWLAKRWPERINIIREGRHDFSIEFDAYLAGARMARERDAKMTAEEKLLRAIFGPTGRPAKEADQ